MNQRIDELMIEAGARFEFLHGVHYDDFQYEKFAELIVLECAEIALEQKKWVEDMKVHNPHDEVWNKARIQQSQHIVDKIREHFGVKE